MISYENTIHNASYLDRYDSPVYIASEDTFSPLYGANAAPIFAKIAFWIRDLLSWGNETNKIHALALKTLNEIKNMMNSNEPRLGFNYYNENHGAGAHSMISFGDLAATVLRKKHFLHTNSEIVSLAREINTQFYNHPIFKKYPKTSPWQWYKLGTGPLTEDWLREYNDMDASERMRRFPQPFACGGK